MRKFFIPLTFLALLLLPTLATAQNELTEKGGFVVANRPNDLPELRTGITKYIWKYHPNDKLKITQIQIDGELTEVPLVHVTGFQNKARAMEFYDGLKTNRPDFMQMGMTKDFFPLSKTNYEKVLRAKSLNGYKPFFQQNYF
jgi:hypothetical protein